MIYQKHTALLIDAENTPIAKLAAYLDKAQPFGRDITLKRAYGSNPCLKNWEDLLRTHAVRPVQLFDCAAGKNAADIALAVDAMELLHTGQYDTFIIMSGDSDYTPLAMKLRDAGVRVLGIGKDDAPEAYRNACTGYLCLHNIYAEDPDSLQALQEQFSHFDEDDLAGCDLIRPSDTSTVEEALDGIDQPDLSFLFDKGEPDERATQKAKDILREIGLTDDDEIPEETIVWDTLDDSFPNVSHQEDTDQMRGVHKLLHIAYDYCKGEDGFAILASIGNFIKEIRPDFHYRDYGFAQLHELLLAYPDQYQVIKDRKTRVMSFRCL